MDRLEALRAFVLISETGSFAASARRLHVSPTAVTRAISGLEARLQTALLHRTTRAVTLTDEGAVFLPRARRIIEEVTQAEAEILGKSVEPSGLLSITAPVLYGRMHIMPIIACLCARYPKLRVRGLLLDRVVNLAEEGIDIAIRIGTLPDSALVSVTIGQVRQVLAASPYYLTRRGTPDNVQDLKGHNIVAFNGLGSLNEWRFADGSVSSRIDPVLEVNTADAAIEAVRAGMGIGRFLSYQVHDDVEAGRLTGVLPDYDPVPVPVSLVFPSSRRNSSAVRAFIEAAKSATLPETRRM